MNRHLLAVACCTWILAAPALGASFQPLIDAPDSYVPGAAITFGVQLPAIAKLGAYDLDLVVESTAGVAGQDFLVDDDATGPASVGYVFPSTANYAHATTIESNSRLLFTITDFDLSGFDVTPGANDRLATIMLRTSPTFRGELAIYVDATSLILDAPAIGPAPVPEFAEIQSAIAAALPIRLNPVPEPSLAAFAAGSLGVLAFRGRRQRRQHKGEMCSLTVVCH